MEGRWYRLELEPPSLSRQGSVIRASTPGPQLSELEKTWNNELNTFSLSTSKESQGYS